MYTSQADCRGDPLPPAPARRIKPKAGGGMKDLVRGRDSTDRGIDLHPAQ